MADDVKDLEEVTEAGTVDNSVDGAEFEIEGLELSQEVGDDGNVTYTGTMEYTRPIAFEAKFAIDGTHDKKSVRAALIAGAVYTDEQGGQVNGYIAMHAPFKALIKLILKDMAEIAAE